MAEGQQQSGITAQQQKDMQDLEKLGEQLGEKAKQNVINSSKKDMNNTKSVQLYTNNSVGHTNKLLSVLDITLGFAIVIAIPLILRKMTKSNIEKSKFSKFKYNYFGYAYKSSLLVYIGFIISVLFPSMVIAYIVCAVIGSIVYIHLKRKGKFLNNIKNENLSNKYVEPGAVLGSLSGQLIVKPCNQPADILVIGAPGKGKSQSLCIPTLLNWKGSALVIDIKRELYAYTHNVQAKKGKVIVFDPEQNGHAYDPIKECDTVDSCQFLARSLIPTPTGSTDPFWTENAQNVLAAACYEGNKNGKTLPEISERILLTEPEQLVEELTNSEYKEVRLLASSVKGTPDKTLGGIFTELKNAIILFATDENIKRALSKSEWSPETLEEDATIYLRVSERQVETYKKVWNMIIVQIIRHLNSRKNKDLPVLLLLDELPRLGKVEGYIPSLTTLRWVNVTVFSAAQSLAQFDLNYGKDGTRTMMDATTHKLLLSAADDETQQIFSRLAGKYEREKTSVNANWTWGGGGGGKSKFKQWEDRFRPETLAYLERPIYYPPDREAFQIDKAYWMKIPYFIKLQKDSGGPLTFIDNKDFEELSKFTREDTQNASTIDDITYKNNNLEDKQKEKVYEPSHEAAVDINNDNDNVSKKENKEYIGPIKLFEKWKIK